MMKTLPIIVSKQEAIDYYVDARSITDAERSYVIAKLTYFGLSNKEIREVLSIDKVYTVTHYKRVGLQLTESELELWMNNSQKITMGHVRAIAKLLPAQRDKLLRDLLVKKIPVHEYEKMAKGQAVEKSSDISSYANDMSEQLGRPIIINYNSAKQSGTLCLSFYGLDDLDDVSQSLGYTIEN